MKYCPNKPAQLGELMKLVLFASFLLTAFTNDLCLAQNKRPSLSKVEPQRLFTDLNAPDLKSLNVLADTETDYLIASGDVISIQIEDAPELSRMYRVSAAGKIRLPWIGEVTAQNMTTEGLANILSSVLRQKEYLLEPNVVVNVNQYNSQTYFLQGAVHKPGFFQVEGRPTMLKLIGLAGGLTEGHGSTAFIVRRKKTADQSSANAQNELDISDAKHASNTASSETNNTDTPVDKDDEADFEMIKLNLAAIYKGHFEENQRLMPGDIVNIPRSDVFFVAGEVNAPGSFTLKEGTTLRQAISLAQGTTFKAKLGKGIIFRENQDNGHRQELAVDIGAVMNGKAEDLPILANDVIIVPNSRMKSVGSTLLSAFGANAARIPVRY